MIVNQCINRKTDIQTDIAYVLIDNTSHLFKQNFLSIFTLWMYIDGVDQVDRRSGGKSQRERSEKDRGGVKSKEKEESGFQHMMKSLEKQSGRETWKYRR